MHTPRIVLAITLGAIIASPAIAADGYLTQPALHGDRLVFVSEGDLWTATLPADPAARVTAYRLTNGAGLETNPVLSPDGSHVAFSAEYEGNRDVYVMPLDGDAPVRVTFHPDADVPLAFSADGQRIAFRSTRSNPLGRQELFWVDAKGGLAQPAGIGECSQISLDPKGGSDRFAFSRWSNENWFWKRYRGGTAPEVWVGDLGAKTFSNLTNNRANDLFPMWIAERVYFASDRDGVMNLWSALPDGSDLKQHTRFVNDATKPTDPATYEMRFPSPDRAGGGRIAFAQAGDVSIFDSKDNSVRRLSIDLVSDRPGVRTRFVSAVKNASAFSLSPSGDRLLLEARGDLVTVPSGKPTKGVQVGWRQITHDAPTSALGSREWGATWLNDKDILCVTDSGGEQQLGMLPADGSATPQLVTNDRAQWLMRPVASPDGKFVAFGDKNLKLWLFDVQSRTATQVDVSEAGEIVDYAFSPDGAWLAWSKPMPNGNNWMTMRSCDGATTVPLSDGLTNDREPRFDPKGAYLWFLSDRHIDPIISGPDFEFVIAGMTEVFAVPLKKETPPPSPKLAAAAGFDLKKWAEPTKRETDEGKEGESTKATAAKPEAKEDEEADEDEVLVVTVDADGIRERIWRAPIEPGNHRLLAPTSGGVYVLTDPIRGIADVEWPAPPLGEAIGTLRRFTALDGQTKEVTESIATYAASRGAAHVAWLKDGKFTVHASAGEGDKDESVEVADVLVRIEPRAEWSQMLYEAWRLQRDFYWAPNMAGVDWNAMRERYRALLPKVGNRTELSDVMGQLISELGTSHTYIMGGDEPDRPKPIAVGSLGVEFGTSGNAVTIASILPGRPGDDDLISPLAMPHLGVTPGTVVLSIDGRPVRPDRDPYELLQDRAGKPVVLEIADDAQGNNRRTIEVVAREGDRPLLYARWVDANRRKVDEASQGTLGYVHVPDMDTEGLVEFSRTFFPQIKKKGMVVDIRDNGGGYVSQLILARIARKPWAYDAPRQGVVATYPTKVLDGPFVILIDQNAGSDGDIFPESVRINGVAPLIGTRTWGGVVGIRADKPFVDLGVSTQPEFAWFDPRKQGEAGWSVENDGVAPDIEVDITPGDRVAGRDPQLQKGIDVLLETIKKSPRSMPPLPPYPNRSKSK